MKIIALGLIAVAIVVVARRKEPEDTASHDFLQRQLVIRTLKIQAGATLNYHDYAARRATLGLD